MIKHECTVTRAYEIADEAMYELLTGSAICDPDGRYILEEPEAKEAARWLICRGMAKAVQGRLEILVGPEERDAGVQEA